MTTNTLLDDQFMQTQTQLVKDSLERTQHESATYAYAYAAGYFQSMAEQMFAQMTKRQKAEFLRQVELDAARLEALLTV